MTSTQKYRYIAIRIQKVPFQRNKFNMSRQYHPKLSRLMRHLNFKHYGALYGAYFFHCPSNITYGTSHVKRTSRCIKNYVVSEIPSYEIATVKMILFQSINQKVKKKTVKTLSSQRIRKCYENENHLILYCPCFIIIFMIELTLLNVTLINVV